MNILATTHNPATLDSLEEDALNNVVVCTWDRQKQTSSLIEFPRLPFVHEMQQRGSLGDLVTKRILEQYLDPNFAENRKKSREEWVEGLPNWKK